MRLLRLEMQGFKSFAEKTTIDFGPGVTGIIGPNGCGKSNVSDAVRWVLGEQSLKSLRGSKSEDVIFSGSSTRKALNMAEVSLTFDNEDHFFALDYEEVTVGRRVFRSGEGVYMINRKPCRLKDVVDLFRDTGLGKDALAVVGQNKIDELLSCTAEERRGAFEELAGIARFKNRKKDALKRMEQTEHNLLRIQDIMITMAEELPKMEEAKKKTEAYQELKREMRSGELRWIASEWEKLTAQENKLREEEKNFVDADKKIEEIRQQRAALLAELLQKMAESESALKVWQEDQLAIQNRLQEVRTEIAVQSERLEQNATLSRMLTEDESKRNESREEIQKQLEENTEKLVQAKELYLQKKEEFSKAQKEQEIVQKRWNEIRTLLENGRDNGFSSLQEIVTLRNRNQSLQDDFSRYGRQGEKLSQEKELLLRQSEEISKESLQLEQDKKRIQSEVKQIEENIHSKQKSLLEIQEKKAGISRSLEKSRSEEQDVRLRVRWLGDMLENHEGFSHGVRFLLQAKTSWRPNILGTVAELFTVQPEYRTALEVALGGTMQNIICKTEIEAREGIAYLKSKKAGRVTFLPLTTLQVNDSKKEENLLKQQGCLGRASDFVEAPQEVVKAVQFLLQRTLVVDTMETALAIGKLSNFSVRIVTLQGEILRPGGSITGGSTGKERESFWSRREELEKLTAILAEKEKAVQDLEGQWAELLKNQENNQKELDRWNQEIQELRTQERIYREQWNHSEQRKNAIRDEIREVEAEYQESKAQTIQIQEAIHQIEIELQKAQSKEEERKIQVEKLQNESSQLDQDKDVAQQNLTQLQVETFGREQECQHLSNRLSELQNTLEAETKALGDIKKRAEDIQSIQQAGTNRLANLQAEQINQEGSLETVQAGTLKAEEYWKKLQAEKQEKDKEDLLQEREENKIREKRHDWEMRFQRLSFEQEKWKIHLEEEFQMDIEAALAEADSEVPLKGLSDRLAVLRNRLGEIGEVNPYAIEEYQRHQEKYSFYETQSADLQSARQSLQRLLNELNKEMSEQFKETFDKVSIKFQRIFLELFGGGKAELTLTDPTHILETGVEIFVQPPGKKLQNMTLLSGGERALTVIALLFAFMECRPSPFYLADEVDAALDEANVRRFSQFLKEYSEHSQFIVVTHRRGTMEIADTLHGITMENAGISKLISVRFEGNQISSIE